MALPMLVNGADCGPINPLQGLTKQLDRDRGLQQDHFGAGRAGSSKEVFRSQYTSTPGIDQDAARFFSANVGSSSASPAPFDLSLMHNALPATASSHAQTPLHSTPSMKVSSTAWASDFMQHPPGRETQSALTQAFLSQPQPVHASPIHQEMGGTHQPEPTTWAPGFVNRMSSMTYQRPFNALGQASTPQLAQSPQYQVDDLKWNEAFSTHESVHVLPETVTEEALTRRAEDPDELARAAGSLIQAVQNEQNPKFQKSAFLGLMKQLRDGDVTVEGDKMVPKEGIQSEGINGWATDFQATSDVKGKGRAVERPIPSAYGYHSSTVDLIQVPQTPAVDESNGMSAEDEIDAYFRQENDAYIKYHNPQMAEQHPGLPSGLQAQTAEWDKLQDDWSKFEVTATGLRSVADYQFAQNNPYLNSEATRHHSMHSYSSESLHESVLQMEAAVQRDPKNAEAWYSLGVKQQENEREMKAISALRQALKLNPKHLPSWVAIAISHTNDGNRVGAHAAIQEWVNRNQRYSGAVEEYRRQFPMSDDMTQMDKTTYLVNCLVHMSRSTGEEIDADIQIALAVLMNSTEAYEKSKDCFLVALALRPDEPQLYNRVGATLANNGQASDALQYYYKALELNPSYIRARFNLGISCINLRRYQEASSHILDALALQEADAIRNHDGSDDKRGVTSTALWDSLKTCCLHLRRLDLATLCDRRDLEGETSPCSSSRLIH
ncbi:hypothetical protein BC835DRAFT_1306007 [Cytidiella melzeri]|nr:hypothetical protein BC835DRAFT_1306007 [Cytidiella melzeri]